VLCDHRVVSSARHSLLTVYQPVLEGVVASLFIRLGDLLVIFIHAGKIPCGLVLGRLVLILLW
jgi:hypothetical protein